MNLEKLYSCEKWEELMGEKLVLEKENKEVSAILKIKINDWKDQMKFLMVEEIEKMIMRDAKKVMAEHIKSEDKANKNLNKALLELNNRWIIDYSEVLHEIEEKMENDFRPSKYFNYEFDLIVKEALKEVVGIS